MANTICKRYGIAFCACFEDQAWCPRRMAGHLKMLSGRQRMAFRRNPVSRVSSAKVAVGR